jgi:hypothetical protein
MDAFVPVYMVGAIGVVLLVIAAIAVALFATAVVCRNIVIGLCVTVAVTILTSILGAGKSFFIFWDMPSFFLVGCTVVVLVSGQGKWKLFSRGLKTSLSVSSIHNTPDAAEIAALFRYVANGTLWGGGLWALTGLIQILYSRPDTTAMLYQGLGVSALTIFYSLILYIFLFNPIAHRNEQAIRSADVCDK